MTEMNNVSAAKPKVLILNGSPHKEGTTYRALCEVAKTLEKEGVEAEIVHVGHLTVRGCSGCYMCGKLKKCVHDDIVNEILDQRRGSIQAMHDTVILHPNRKISVNGRDLLAIAPPKLAKKHDSLFCGNLFGKIQNLVYVEIEIGNVCL